MVAANTRRQALWSASERTRLTVRRKNRHPIWVKIKNPKYSQAEGRQELFEREPTV
jgi:hypothetical protein